jgi:hypothetical protein
MWPEFPLWLTLQAAFLPNHIKITCARISGKTENAGRVTLKYNTHHDF